MDNYLEIYRSALCANARTVCEYVDVPVIGVVKCNGYGLSVKTAAEVWVAAGVKLLAVSSPDEALELRKEGFTQDILLLSPIADAETLCGMLENRIILTVTGVRCAEFYCRHSGGAPIHVHVAIDTGMGRFGVKWSDNEQLKAIYNMPCFVFEGVFSHFSKSFEKEYNFTRIQLLRFLSAVNGIINAGFSVGIRHIANSSAALRFPETRLDAVRVGSALIGELNSAVSVKLEKTYCFKAKAVDIKYFDVGDTVGYAAVCKIKRPVKTVIVAVGYENGFGYIKTPFCKGVRGLFSLFARVTLRYLKRSYVTYKDKRLPIVGRIGNQYTLFDAGDCDIKIGDYVTVDVPLLFPHKSKRIR